MCKPTRQSLPIEPTMQAVGRRSSSLLLKRREVLPRLLNFQQVQLYNNFNNKRLLSTSKIFLDEAKSDDTKPKKDKTKLPEFNPKFMGVASQIFIPASKENLPSIFSRPITVLKTWIRRIYMFGLNTFKIGLFRIQSGIKPSFLLWKNNAIENYIEVNKAFAARDVSKIKNQVSIWVERALIMRSQTLPKHIKLDWHIIRFNEIPKLMSLDPIMAPGMPLEYIQLVYRFNTKQELIKINTETNESEKQVKDIIDYLVFLCDTNTNELMLSGSIFENKPGAPLPKPVTADEKKEVLTRMRECGDIFRLPPQSKE